MAPCRASFTTMEVCRTNGLLSAGIVSENLPAWFGRESVLIGPSERSDDRLRGGGCGRLIVRTGLGGTIVGVNRAATSRAEPEPINAPERLRGTPLLDVGCLEDLEDLVFRAARIAFSKWRRSRWRAFFFLFRSLASGRSLALSLDDSLDELGPEDPGSLGTPVVFWNWLFG